MKLYVFILKKEFFILCDMIPLGVVSEFIEHITGMTVYPLEEDFRIIKLKISFSGEGRQYNGLIDVYRKTLASDGLAGLYRGFAISCVGIIVYRGCYFGFYDSIKPVLLGDNPNLFASFL